MKKKLIRQQCLVSVVEILTGIGEFIDFKNIVVRWFVKRCGNNVLRVCWTDSHQRDGSCGKILRECDSYA